MLNIFKAIAVFVTWWFLRDNISHWNPTLQFFVHLFGIGLPIGLVLERIISSAIKRRRSRPPKAKKTASNAQTNTSLLTPMQIQQLKELRSRISLDEAKHFPEFAIEGKDIGPNISTEAGVFTTITTINNKNENIVVMLAFPVATKEFSTLYYRTDDKYFWAKGHLIPSRSGMCYSVLLVTSFFYYGRYLPTY